MMEITGAHVAVTGGGSGLGEAVALALAGRGARVTVIDRNAEGAARVAAAIKGFAEGDRIRDELQSQGITLIDKPGGVTQWHRN